MWFGYFSGYWFFWLAIYVYMAVCLQTIARKLGAKDDWMAWVPILNLYLMCVVAERPVWWMILFFIPLVNIVVAVIVWMRIAERRNRPNWWGILLIIPIVNLVIPALLAFQESAQTPTAAPPSPPPPPPPPSQG
jgi:magnesium-transporting ATPase (P-type)